MRAGFIEKPMKAYFIDDAPEPQLEHDTDVKIQVRATVSAALRCMPIMESIPGGFHPSYQDMSFPESSSKRAVP